MTTSEVIERFKSTQGYQSPATLQGYQSPATLERIVAESFDLLYHLDFMAPWIYDGPEATSTADHHFQQEMRRG